MQDFLNIVFSFPTVVFTTLLGVCLFFWLLVIAGGMGFEIFDFDIDVGAAGEEAGSSIAEFLSVLGVGTVPFSITATAFVFWGWTLSFLATYFARMATDVTLLVAFGLLVGVTILALPLTGVITAPLKTVFDDGDDTPTSESLIGAVVEISTSRVDEEFGRAKVYHDGAELILTVRCEAVAGLERGDRALLIEHDETHNFYRVEPYDAFVGGEDDDGEDVTFDDRLAEAEAQVAEQTDEAKEEQVEEAEEV